MPLFDYSGQSQTGATFSGTLEAESQHEAAETLAGMGLRVMSLRPVQRRSYVAPLSLDDFLFFNEQLAAMTKASVPLQEGLRQLAGDVGSRKLKRVLLELAEDLEAGTPLELALEKLHSRFPTQYSGVVRAGLKSGDLGGVLYGLTAHLRLKSEFRRALMELGVYPLMTMLVAFGVLAFLMRVVVPQLELTILDITGWGYLPYEERLERLPAFSCLVFKISHVWPKIELAAGGVLLGIGLLSVFASLQSGRRFREFLLRRIPGVAQVYWSSVLARFAHTSALAAFSGTPLPELIAAGGESSGSTALAETTRRVAGKISAGLSLEESTHGQNEIPGLWTCVVSATASRGELPAALEELARMYELRAKQWNGIVRVMLGPVLLLGVGLILGTVIVGLLMPLINLLQGLTS